MDEQKPTNKRSRNRRLWWIFGTAILAARQSPGEIFNLPPEVFLNNAFNNFNKPVITTSESHDLPLRF